MRPSSSCSSGGSDDDRLRDFEPAYDGFGERGRQSVPELGHFALFSSMETAASLSKPDANSSIGARRVVPNPEVQPDLLDHLIGAAEQRERNGETKRLCDFEVNDQLDSHGLLDR